MSTVTLVSNLGLDDVATNDDTSTVGEPSVAGSDGNLFITGNWYASRSTDDGASWTHVDPFTTLPSAAGGFCCDQVTIHDSSRGVWIWILQYIEQDGANVFRVAATRDDDFADGRWHWWDIGPSMLNPDWTDVWFDYPDAALSAEHLLVTFNVFNAAGEWQRASIMRFPLDTVRDGGTLNFGHWSTTDNGSLRLAQGAGSTAYWASHNSTSQLRLFQWPDGENTISWWDIDVAPWSETISSTAPNGVDWLARADPRITGGCRCGGRLTFLWTAGSADSRPHAYCRVVRIDEATKRVVDQPDIWSSDRAWAYPAAGPNGDGALGFTAFYGGVDRPPGHVVGARDDAGSAWTSAYARQGSDSPNEAKWGDYLTCRAYAPASDTWIAAGYTLQDGGARSDVVPQVVRFTVA